MIIKGGEMPEIIIVGSGGSGEGSSLSVESGPMAIEGGYGGSSKKQEGMLVLNDGDWDDCIVEHGEPEEVKLSWWLRTKIKLRHRWTIIKRKLGFGWSSNDWTFIMYDNNNKKPTKIKTKRVRINFKNM